MGFCAENGGKTAKNCTFNSEAKMRLFRGRKIFLSFFQKVVDKRIFVCYNSSRLRQSPLVFLDSSVGRAHDC